MNVLRLLFINPNEESLQILALVICDSETVLWKVSVSYLYYS